MGLMDYLLKDSTVIIDPSIVASVNFLATTYFQATGDRIVITEGTRTATTQASAMFNNIERGRGVGIYRNQTAAQES